MLKRVDHIAVTVPNVNAMAAFFKRMGFEEIRRTDHHGGAVEVKLPGEGQVVFEFTTLRGTENPGVNHVAFQVDDCERAVAELQANGIAFDSVAHTVPETGRVIASFRDPLGFRLQVTE
jgi:glyoxylase I family protein